MIIKLLTTGYVILLLAIIANIIADYIQISTWYKFLHDIISNGLSETIQRLDLLDIIWLFVIYPLILSIGYIIGEIIYVFIAS